MAENPTPANEKLLDTLILRSVWINRYRQRVANDALDRFNEELHPVLIRAIEERLRTLSTGRSGTARRRELLRLMDSLRDLSNSGFSQLQSEIATELQAVAGVEGEWTTRALSNASSSAVVFSLPPVVTFNSIVNEAPYLGYTFREWFGDIDDTTMKHIQRQIQIGLTLGETQPQIVSRIEGSKALGFRNGVMGSTRRNIEAIVRTGVIHITGQARQAVYSANSEVLQGVLWVSTLDTKTSDICISLDGQVFPVDSGPRPPAHLNCRSVIAPLLKSFRELGIPIDDLPEGTRASLNGQVPAKLTYSEWLQRQPAKIQNEVLGPARAKLFRSGKLNLRDLIDDRFQTLTLEQLRSK